MKLILWHVFIAVSLHSLSATAVAVAYKATLLHPNGLYQSSATAISAGSSVGHVEPAPQQFATHAALWNGEIGAYVDLHPSELANSEAVDNWGPSQVGYGRKTQFGADYRALLWKGTADSVVDLTPVGFDFAQARGVFGEVQVGWGIEDVNAGDGIQRAFLWHGTSESAVDLTPSSFRVARAEAISEVSQVGWGIMSTARSLPHALLWKGSAESFVDLHPSGSTYSQTLAYGVSGNSQVGYGRGPTGLTFHAILWNGTAESVIDLSPTGFDRSEAVDVSGSIQVGSGQGPVTEGLVHALVWRGTADSVVDLHQYAVGLLPGVRSSGAGGIDADGNIVGTVSDNRGLRYAVIWRPVPEPTSVVCELFVCAMCLLRRNRYRNDLPRRPRI